MISAVITAAGNSTRFGADKLWLKLNAKPVIEQTIAQFLQVRMIREIIVVIKKGDAGKYRRDRVKLVEGGKERINSLLNGVTAAQGEMIITHDGARPLVSTKLIKQLIASGLKYPAVMTVIKPTATVKLVKNNRVNRSLPREETWLAQTPQMYKKEILLAALTKAIKQGLTAATDDSEIVAKFAGVKVKVVAGEDTNIKITTPVDLRLADQLIKEGLV